MTIPNAKNVVLGFDWQAAMSEHIATKLMARRFIGSAFDKPTRRRMVREVRHAVEEFDYRAKAVMGGPREAV